VCALLCFRNEIFFNLKFSNFVLNEIFVMNMRDIPEERKKKNFPLPKSIGTFFTG
jgi:hypothetical protein